jgi:hypothetical protein
VLLDLRHFLWAEIRSFRVADHYPHEAGSAKMHAAQTGAPEAAERALGPSPMDQAAVKQRGAMHEQADTQDATKAAQAQAQ